MAHPRRFIDTYHSGKREAHTYIMQYGSAKATVPNTIASVNVFMNSDGETIVYVEGAEGCDITVKYSKAIKVVEE